MTQCIRGTRASLLDVFTISYVLCLIIVYFTLSIGVIFTTFRKICCLLVKINNLCLPFQRAVSVCPLVMFAFLTMVTETDGKPANEYEYQEGAKPVYMKIFQRAPRLFYGESEDGSGIRGPGLQLCCCPDCLDTCSCCCA